MKLTIRVDQTDNGDFLAVCQSLPGCMSRGKTHDEARETLGEAIRGYIAAVSDFEPNVQQQELVEV